MPREKLSGVLSPEDVEEVATIFDEVAAQYGFAPQSADHVALASLVIDLAMNSGYRGSELRNAAERFCQRLKATG